MSVADSRISARTWYIAAIAIATGAVLFLISALTKAPHVDEGDLASAATSLLDAGHFAFPMSYYYQSSVRGEYLLPPLYFGTLAGWFAAFGRSIESYRLFHGAWWLLLVVAWTSVAASIGRTRAALIIAAVLLALNYDLVNLGVSRYDITCAALNAAAIAAYLGLRETRFNLAVFASNTFLACAALSHPNAIYGLLGCLIFVIGTGDWRRIRPLHIALALIPYVIAFGGWALQINGRWAMFIDQMTYGARSKHTEVTRPLAVLADDFRVRWIELFAGWRPDVPRLMRAKTGFIVVWALGVLTILFSRGDTLISTKLRRSLGVFAVLSPILLAFTDSLHLQIYVLNVIPQCTVALALIIADLWKRRPALRPLTGVAVAGMALFAVATIAYRGRKHELTRGYGVVASTIQKNIEPDAIVIGPSEFGFGLDFDKRVRNDPRLETIGEGKLPQYIVRSTEQGELSFPQSATCEVSIVGLDSMPYSEVHLPTEVTEYRLYRRGAASAAADVHMLRYCHAGKPSPAN